jgi:hypothetical protein
MSDITAENRLSEDEMREILYGMEQNKDMVTVSAFRANSELWPDNRISFTDAHLAYIKSHPDLDPKHYLSNLRLRLTKRS